MTILQRMDMSRRPRPDRQSGFTLLEILVVVVIIGIIISVATLSFGVLGRDREVEDQVRRFWAVLQQAREESELQSLDVGVYVANSAYEFLRFQARDNAWLPIGYDDLYATRELPQGLRFRIWLDGREIILKPRLPEREVAEAKEEDESAATAIRALDARNAADAEQRNAVAPQIVIFSSGEIVPFELQVERDGQKALWRVIGQADNDLRVERRDESPDAKWVMMLQTRPPEEEDEEQLANARR